MTDVATGETTGYEPAGSAEPADATMTQTAPYAMPATYNESSPAPDESFVDSARERAGEAFGHAGDAVHDASEAVGDAADRAYEATKDAAGNLVTRLRNNATVPAARGKTTIASEVVEKIAGIAAREVPGVYDLGGDAARLFSSVREKLHLGDESAAQGVSVTLEGKNAEILIVIVIEFGFQVFSVTEKVREKVISSVENLLGLDVTAVDVTVDDVHITDDGPLGNDAERAAGYSPETKAIVVGAPAAN